MVLPLFSDELLAVLRQRLQQGSATAIIHKRNCLKPLLAQLDALSPLRILSRGYALARKLPELTLVQSAEQLKRGDRLRLQFAAGHLRFRHENNGRGAIRDSR